MKTRRFLAITAVAVLIFGLGSGVVAVAEDDFAADGIVPHGDSLQAAPSDVPADWLRTVEEEIRLSEYHVTWQDETYLPDVPQAYHAANRAHGFRTYFTPAGIQVIPRSESARGWQLGLSLVGYGSPGALAPVGSAQPESYEGLVVFRHEGHSQSYLNSEAGLSHSILIPSDPDANASELDLALRLSGDLVPTIVAGGQSVEFTTASGDSVLQYGSLRATDSSGRRLPAQLAIQDGRELRISVDDARAAYPVTVELAITGMSTTPDWGYIGGQMNEYVGVDVGSAGDVNGDGYSDVLVGAHGYDGGETNEGRVLLFYGGPAGLSPTPGWDYEPNIEMTNVGRSVATAGDVDGDGYADIIIGASGYDLTSTTFITNVGAAYLFFGSPAGPASSPDWMVTGESESDVLGAEVGTAGDVDGDGLSDFFVASYNYTVDQPKEGVVFVWHGSNSGLSTTPDWRAESNQTDSNFGRDVDTAGDVDGDGYSDLIVGAYWYTDGQSKEGGAFVWYGSADGLGPANGTPGNADWQAQSGISAFTLGQGVGTAGDVNGDGYADIIVGVTLYNYDGSGEALLWLGSASGLGPNGTLANYDWRATGVAGARLGWSVGTAGDVNGDGFADVLVGAREYTNGQSYEGAAFLWYGSADIETRADGTPSNADWSAEMNQADASFGWSSGTAGDVNGDGLSDVIVGAYIYDKTNGTTLTDAGGAWVYYGSASDPDDTPDWSVKGTHASEQMASSVSTAGDVNGDGYADVIVGASWYDGGLTQEGRALLFFGGPSGLSASPDWEVESNIARTSFGSSVGTAGDVNGDGYADIVVGAAAFDITTTTYITNAGAVFLFYGSSGGPSTSADWMATGEFESDTLGNQVGTAGDVNGDGYSDFFAASSSYDNDQVNEGAVFVWHGSDTGPGSTPDWRAESNQLDSYFAYDLDTAGDVNGDGYSDIIVGAYHYDDPESQEGAAFVWYGSAAGLGPDDGTPDNADWEAQSNTGGFALGKGVGTAGDTNGDGYADIIIGVTLYNYNGEGEALVWLGSDSGLGPTGTLSNYDWRATGVAHNGRMGWSVGTAGDMNGDGYADVLAGARDYSNGQSLEGAVFIWYGSADMQTRADGTPSNADWSAEMNQANAKFGQVAGTAGDVNGDGFADIIVGTYQYDVTSPSFIDGAGGAWVYYGSGGAGLSMLPRQMRSDGSAPVAHLGMTDEPFEIQMRLTGRMPMGREDVKLQYQVAPLGTPFTSTSIISGTDAVWTDVLTTGVTLTAGVTGLAPNMPYRWRARLLYHPGNRMGQPASRWIHIPWNGWDEIDFRTCDAEWTYLPLTLRSFP